MKIKDLSKFDPDTPWLEYINRILSKEIVQVRLLIFKNIEKKIKIKFPKDWNICYLRTRQLLWLFCVFLCVFVCMCVCVFVCVCVCVFLYQII